MKYFLHDTAAFADEKITMLFMEFGYEGVGLFYTILERLALQEKPVSEDVLKTQLYIKKKLQKQLEFMYKIELLSIKNGDVFSETLLNFSEKYQIKKEKTRKRVSEWRAKREDVTRYERVRNTPKVKLSKVKENKRKNIPPDVSDISNVFLATLKNGLREKVNPEKWNDSIDKLMRIDKHKKEDIIKVIKYYRTNDFWSKNFLSPCKLREKNKQGIAWIDVWMNELAEIDEKENQVFI